MTAQNVLTDRLQNTIKHKENEAQKFTIGFEKQKIEFLN